LDSHHLAPFRVALLLPLFTVMPLGCVTGTPSVNVDPMVARATGSEAIRFTTDGEPTEVEASIGSTLTIASATQRTLAHDPRIQSAMARLRATHAEARQSRLLPNPVLNVALRLPTEGGGSIIEAGLSQDLVALLSRPGRVTAADNRLRASAAEVVTTVLDVLSEVRERYVAVQTLGAALDVLNERLTIVDRLLDLARTRLRLGEGTRLDVLTLETQRVELEAEVADRQLELREQRLALARLLGEPSAAADWQLPEWAAEPIESLPESRWVELALTNRPDAIRRLRRRGSRRGCRAR
jgi:cobalt-zinc-cadmium efflux system outer membrane protein